MGYRQIGSCPISGLPKYPFDNLIRLNIVVEISEKNVLMCFKHELLIATLRCTCYKSTNFPARQWLSSN